MSEFSNTPSYIKNMKKTVKRTERGWAGHFICASRCEFRRNTLLECENIKIVVSTVGNFILEDKVTIIGLDRYYETMAFHSKIEDTRYFDADVTKTINFESEWAISNNDADDSANLMHETVVAELTEKLENNFDL